VSKRLFGIIFLGFVIGVNGFFGFGEPLQKKPNQANLVRADQDVLLKQYETSDRKFIKKKIGHYIVYRHLRKIGEAIVEHDFIRYKFDAKTNKLVDKKMQWRSDLPEKIPPVIEKSKAEAVVKGKVQFSVLYIISPKSRIFRIKPVPKDPCWIVSSIVDGRQVISIINANTGKFIGYGEPPPSATPGFSLVGPNKWHECADLPQYWRDLRDNARQWFILMGYPTSLAEFPNDSKVKSYIQNWETAVFYEIAHSGTGYGEPRNKTFLSGCDPEKVTSLDVRNWIIHCPKMRFAFLTSCFSMCDTESSDTLSYAFRKGSSYHTSTVGGCGLSESQCFSCWDNYYDWQNEFLSRLRQGATVREAFDDAMVNYSECDGCIRFAGDETLRLVPALKRNLEPIIAYWPIREGAGTSISDYTPRHNNGTINGTVWTWGISGPGGANRHWSSALKFDGNNDFVGVAYNAVFNLTNFTLEAWVRFTDRSQTARIISRPSDGDPTHGYSFFNMSTSRGRLCGGVQGEGKAYSSSVCSRDNFADGVWHKCTFVRDANRNTIKIYVDGRFQGAYANASTGNMAHNRKGLFIGSYNNNGGFFNGTICNVKIWGKALTADAIQENFMWEVDDDGDGIVWQVDPAPGAYSNRFRNGSTIGTITNRGDQILTVIPKASGVLIKADEAGGATPAIVRISSSGVTYTLNPGDEIQI
jgi:hypothetical protein